MSPSRDWLRGVALRKRFPLLVGGHGLHGSLHAIGWGAELIASSSCYWLRGVTHSDPFTPLAEGRGLLSYKRAGAVRSLRSVLRAPPRAFGSRCVARALQAAMVALINYPSDNRWSVISGGLLTRFRCPGVVPAALRAPGRAARRRPTAAGTAAGSATHQGPSGGSGSDAVSLTSGPRVPYFRPVCYHSCPISAPSSDPRLPHMCPISDPRVPHKWPHVPHK